jgi:enoyl-CoA hydratase/carnithine racemase
MMGETTGREISVEVEGAVATLWLDRPDKRNAVTLAMWQELPEVLGALTAGDLRVLLVRGRGGHFCAGADITGLGRRLADHGVEDGYREVNARAEAALVAFPRPTVAVIEGNCIGGGWQIASACDLRVATRGATFGITPAKLGIAYPVEAIRRTVSLLGPSATKRLLFTGELIGCDEAKVLGMVDLACEDDALDDEVRRLCDVLHERSLLTQLATKVAVNAIVDADPAIESLVGAYEAAARDGVDLDEGLAAFVERRAAHFTWRP